MVRNPGSPGPPFSNCRLLGDRVELEGGCVFYLEGTALVSSPALRWKKVHAGDPANAALFVLR
jgi:hypothetical protein